MGVTISAEKRGEIWEAADALRDAHIEDPTINPAVSMATIKKHMGGGSYSYISPVLREWKAAQKPKFTLANIELPDEMVKLSSDITTYLAEKFKETAWTLAEEKIEQGLAEGNARLEDSDQRNQELEEECGRLETVNQNFTRENQVKADMISDMKNTIEEKDGALTTLESNLAQTKEFLNGSDNALKDLQREHKSLKEQYDLSQETLEKHQDTIKELKEQLTNNQAELSKALEQSVSQQKVLENNQKTISSLQTDKDALSESLSKADGLQQEQKENYESKLREIKKDHGTLKSNHDHGCSQIKKLENQLSEKETKLEKLIKTEGSFETAQEQLRKSAIESGELKKENKELHQQIGSLQEKIKQKDQTPKTSTAKPKKP